MHTTRSLVTLVVAALCLFASAPADAAGPPPAERLIVVDVADLQLIDSDWDSVKRRDGWYDPVGARISIALDGATEAYLVLDAIDPSWIMYGELVERVRAGAIVARVDGAGDLVGRLAIESGSDRGPATKIHFTAPAAAQQDATEVDLAYARARHYGALLENALPGSAWFRLLHDRSKQQLARAALAPEPIATPLAARFGPVGGGVDDDRRAWRQRRTDRADAETFGLISGGRALSENLQLDRMLPLVEPGEATVPVDTIAGITLPEFDWAPLVEGLDPALDPLARHLPADRFALFSPSLASFARLLDELEAGGAPVVAAVEARSRDTRSRAFYERQLCAPLDGMARGLGALAVRSVAVTGGDPYLRTGTDLAVLLETSQPELVARFLAAKQAEALAAPEAPERVVVSLGEREITGVVSADRAICSYVDVGDDFVVITNSLELLSSLAAVAGGQRPAMGDSDEYRYFRDRYPLGAEGETAFVVVPDAAIRDWCGPRWRIATARRTRALAHLIDLSLEVRLADTLDSLGLDVGGGLAEPRAIAGLGTVRPTILGPVSDVYGSAAFVTPIAELAFDSVTEREADLYRTWRRGFERNWSNFFDPIGASVVQTGGDLALDVTILPLIAQSDYRDLIQFVGAEQLEGRDGDPHEAAVAHFVSALDREGDELQEAGRELSGFNEAFGPNALTWLGDWWSIHADQSELLDELLEARDLDEAWDVVEADLDLLPIVVQIGVAKPLALAGFLTVLRGMAESSAPGLVDWHTDRTDDGRPFVRVASTALSNDEMAIYYATTPQALILSFNRDALIAALDRWNPPVGPDGERPPRPDESAPTPWPGGSVALEFEPRALLYLTMLDRGGPTEIAREACFANLPILTEWRRRFPDRDPVAVHEELFGERLLCPAGGEYVWDGEWQRVVSTVFGHPADVREPSREETLPPILRTLERLRLGLTFEPEVDGLRARGELLRR